MNVWRLQRESMRASESLDSFRARDYRLQLDCISVCAKIHVQPQLLYPGAGSASDVKFQHLAMYSPNMSHSFLQSKHTFEKSSLPPKTVI